MRSVSVASLVLALVISLAPVALAADPVATYARYCATCHGSAGRGNGPASWLLSPRPRGFTTGQYKFRSTAADTRPTVDDLVRTISHGLAGTSMPGYAAVLSADEITALARHLLDWAPSSRPAAVPVPLGEPIPSSPEAVARGAVLYGRLGCPACHGPDGRGQAWRPSLEGARTDDRPTDLTEPWTFRVGRDPASVVQRLLTGIDGTPMGSYASVVTPAQAWELAHYVGTLARRPIWEASDPELVRTAGVLTDPVARGRYLVNAMLCPLCHTPISPESGAYEPKLFLGGGMRVSAYPWGVWYSKNLTPDPTGLGGWTEADIVAAVTRGVTPAGRRLDPMAMPWPWFSRLTASDARAIAAYLRAVPPVHNPVPSAEEIPVVEAVGGKLLALLGAPVAVEFWGGNAAVEALLRGIPTAPEGRAFVTAFGWLAFVVAAGVTVAGGLWWRHRTVPLGVGSLLLAGWGVLAVWPPLGLMSPEVTVRWLLLGTPTVRRDLVGAPRALAERGEYLATVAPCGLCHTPASAFVGFRTGRTMAGGMEGRWRLYGSAVSTNLTPHREDGIGAVDDATLLRALRSGLGRNGRPMHWQAMPWDILSHWSEEDQRAMLAYLRALPAVRGVVPGPRPPRAGDPQADAFFFGDRASR